MRLGEADLNRDVERIGKSKLEGVLRNDNDTLSRAG